MTMCYGPLSVCVRVLCVCGGIEFLCKMCNAIALLYRVLGTMRSLFLPVYDLC